MIKWAYIRIFDMEQEVWSFAMHSSLCDRQHADTASRAEQLHVAQLSAERTTHYLTLNTWGRYNALGQHLFGR